ncbi:hypothetical protein LNQ81_11420 [Myroides sp. M-43]|uniref:hypothetical protein n=1 Tax=Myroides oncorhynchi TaxID=2893756 RepID=UPI001E5C1C8B|nr:hypothetical protein [Myroides oncorhynchi]MCC9043280.1 hypothetical protein [Myroides oncorhynchi]
MNEFLRYRFLVDSGVDVFCKSEIKSLQKVFRFSDDYFRFLLINGNWPLITISTNISSSCMYDNLVFLEQTNEDCIFSPYIFIVGRWTEDKLIGEVLVGSHKGAIVLIEEDKYCDIDSIEELLEDLDIDNVEYHLQCDFKTVNTLLSEELGIIKLLECSFIDFLENRLLVTGEIRC